MKDAKLYIVPTMMPHDMPPKALLANGIKGKPKVIASNITRMTLLTELHAHSVEIERRMKDMKHCPEFRRQYKDQT